MLTEGANLDAQGEVVSPPTGWGREFALCLAPSRLHDETYTYRRIQHIHPPSGIHHPQSLERDLDLVTAPYHTFTIGLVNVSILQEHHSWMPTPL